MRLQSVLLGIAVLAAASAANGQNCSSYKAHLEALLTAPAGTYKFDGFYGSVPARTVRLPSGKEMPFDGHGISYNMRPGQLVTIEATLEYTLPPTRMKVTDSATQGHRRINGRLACIFEISIADPSASRRLEADLEISDAGRAQFYSPSRLSGSDPTRFVRLTPEVSQAYVLGVVADAVRARDARKPEITQAAETAYLQKLSKAQALQEERAPRYQVLERECADIVANGNRAIGERSYDQHSYWSIRFTNNQCANTKLEYPIFPRR